MNIAIRNIKWIYQKAVCRLFKRDRNLWAFGEWFGNRCCDNSLYLANYVAEHEQQIQPIWICDPEANVSMLHPRIQVIYRNTPEALKILKHAGVLVYGQSLSDFSSEMCLYGLGAVTINLWHGIPWKKIGLDATPKQNRLRYLYTKYLLTLQRPTFCLATSQPIEKAMRGAFCIKSSGIVRAGYPRNAIFFREDEVRQAREKILSELGSRSDCAKDPSAKLITYMPTFRDRTEGVFTFDSLAEDPRLQALLEKHNAIVVQKAHAVNDWRNGATSEMGGRFLRLDKANPAELLAATDLLITDYSGCFFDFLLTDRPIIHYLYDYDYYVNQDRGVYFQKDEVVCGDVADTVEDLLDAMDQNLQDPERRAALREQRREEYLTYESEDSCRVIYEQLRARSMR